MLRFYKAKLVAYEYGLMGLFFLISALLIGINISEIKGVLSQGFIEYSTVSGKIDLSDTRIYGAGANASPGYNIWYNFTVNGVTYRSNLITFDGHVRAKMDEYLRKYPVGKIVTVYYESDNPKFSVLEPESLSWGVVYKPLSPLLIFLVIVLVSRLERS